MTTVVYDNFVVHNGSSFDMLMTSLVTRMTSGVAQVFIGVVTSSQITTTGKEVTTNTWMTTVGTQYVTGGNESMSTGNDSSVGNDSSAERGRFVHQNLVYTVMMCVILVLIILATIVGNIFVIAAIVLERNLQVGRFVNFIVILCFLRRH